MQQWHEAFDLKEPARRDYQGLGKGWQVNQKPVTECVACGECEPKCPQKIAIVARLKEVHKLLGGA
jgi:hypothetical protein